MLFHFLFSCLLSPPLCVLFRDPPTEIARVGAQQALYYLTTMPFTGSSSPSIRTLFFSVLCCATSGSTAPILSFPLNSQVPPVARIGETFSFVFADTTFTSSDGSSLSYSLTDPPPWLSFDNDSRELYGTPQEEDVESGTVIGVNVTLLAVDSTGSTPDDATLVVSRNQAPSVQIPIPVQIQSFGNYSEPSSIIYSPEENFAFAFAAGTFVDPDVPELEYYSVLIDNSPLPAWLSFDAETLGFAGTTPPFSSLVEPPQTFSVKLIASDVVGFSATSVNFSIVVGTHTLTTDQPNITLNGTAGEPLLYDGLVGSIELDGLTADVSQVDVTLEGLPAWLSFDQASWKISGTPSDTAQSTTFNIMMQDAHADVLNITVSAQLATAGSLFQSTFPSLAVKPGSNFSFDLSTYLVNPSTLDVTTDVQPATSWIYWDASSLTLSGDAPSSAHKSTVTVTFTVAPELNSKSRRAAERQSQQLVIQIDPAAKITSSFIISSPTSSISSASSTSASTDVATSGSASSTPEIKWTIIAIVMSVIAAIAILALLGIRCCARKRSKQNSHSTLSPAIRTDPFPEETYIHTPGLPVNSPDPQRTASAKEKDQSPNSQEVTSSPAPAGFGLGAFFANDTQPSMASTPARKVKDFLGASLRSLRVVHVLPLNRRMSTGSDLPDEGHSYHGALDLESSGPPRIMLNPNNETSFRDALESSLPAMQDNSLQITPETAYSADRRRRMSRRISMVKSVQQPTTSTTQRGGYETDPFTNIHVAGSIISPLSPHNSISSFSVQHISPVTPSSLLDRPSFPLASSLVLPDTAATSSRPLRPAHSQKSFTSTASSSINSMRSQTHKLGRKVSAQAKGAIFKLQSPKRKTYAAWGKHQHSRVASTKARRRDPVLEDDESAASPAVGGSRSISSPTMAAGRRSGIGSRNGTSGIGEFTSPRI